MINLAYNLGLLAVLSVVSGFVNSHWKRDTQAGALLQGLVFGGTAILGLLRPLCFASGVIFESGSAIIGLAALFFGPWTAAVACLMTIPTSVFLSGPSAGVGGLALLTSAGIGVAFHRCRPRQAEDVPRFALLLFCFLVHLAVLAMIVVLSADEVPVVKGNGWRALLSYPLATVLIGKILVDRASRNAVLESLRESEERLRSLANNLCQNEEQFRLMMENLADLVAVLDLEGRRVYNSPSYQSLLGNPDQLRGTSSFEEVHPEDRARVMQAFRETVATGVGQRLEYRMVDQDGHARYIESLGSVIRDAHSQVSKVLVVGRDVTKRKQAEEQIQASERKYRELVENANSIILHWTRDGRIVFLNEFGQRFFGYTEAEIRGCHVVGTLVPEFDGSGRKMASLVDQICGNPAAFEQNVNENMRRSGERVWVAWTNKVVLNAPGQEPEILSIGSDITARKQVEEELRATKACLEQRVLERTAELAAAKNLAEQADRTKSAFLAAMSHELRTPLNSVIGFTGLLLQGLAGPLNPEQTKQLRMVKDSGQHLLALINDVLDISKIEAGQIELQRSSFDIGDAIQKVAQTVAPLAERKSLPVVVRLAPGLGSLISDRRRVEQVLLNLLGNAIKFTERGQVTLTAEVEPGMSDGASSTVRISVADTGLGIKPEDYDKLFQPFRQLDTGLARHHEGTGLGLAICKRLVERLGGAITVESQSGAGSTFRFTLPIQKQGTP